MELTQQARDTSSEQQGGTMKILIEEAERLYRQIDKAQVHLINARLNNDEEGKKSAISEMETTMCNAMQLLTCLVEHKDNIVDLGEVWHKYNPKQEICDVVLVRYKDEILIGVHDQCNIDMFLRYSEHLKEKIYFAFVKDLLSKGGEQCKPKDMEQKTEIKVEGTDNVFATQVTNNQSDEEIYGSLLDKLFTTYKSKNADYGSAFSEMFDELGIDYAYGKLREKMNRIKVLRKQANMVEDEGVEGALLDTAGHAILTLVELKKRNK